MNHGGDLSQGEPESGWILWTEIFNGSFFDSLWQMIKASKKETWLLLHVKSIHIYFLTRNSPDKCNLKQTPNPLTAVMWHSAFGIGEVAQSRRTPWNFAYSAPCMTRLSGLPAWDLLLLAADCANNDASWDWQIVLFLFFIFFFFFFFFVFFGKHVHTSILCTAYSVHTPHISPLLWLLGRMESQLSDLGLCWLRGD